MGRADPRVLTSCEVIQCGETNGQSATPFRPDIGGTGPHTRAGDVTGHRVRGSEARLATIGRSDRSEATAWRPRPLLRRRLGRERPTPWPSTTTTPADGLPPPPRARGKGGMRCAL